MIITQLNLENLGAFRGRHEINLRPADGKPIVLFGGKNGAGKTTLFEAIRLCLYGMNSLPGRQRRADYEQFLLERIHRTNALSVDVHRAAVELEFEYAQLGQLAKYTVRREWERRGTNAMEKLSVYKDGQPLEGMDADQWQDFIKDLIPSGLSQLFFFDGEKIEELASHGADSEQFRESMRSLLGLDLVERLQSDLSIHITRQERHANTEALQHKLEAAHKEVAQLQESRELQTRERSQAQVEVDRLRRAIEDQEARLNAEGGSFASKRQELRSKAQQLEREIGEVQERVRLMASGLLPFALTPDYLHLLENRLLEEAEITRVQSAKDLVEERQAQAIKTLRQREFWDDLPLDAKAQKTLVTRLTKLIQTLMPTVEGGKNLVHPCSDPERARLLSWIRQALQEVPKELATHTRKLEKLAKQRREIETQISRAPQEDVIAPIVARLTELSKEFGAAESKVRQLDESIRITDFKLQVAQRQLEAAREELRKAEGISERITAALKARDALALYLQRITTTKLEELSASLAEAFSRLSNKPGYYTRVKIDPKTFETALYNRYGERVTRDRLSAGERQMFATALLWALARTSGRPLPFIIDTPLGRLDHDHRENLVRLFFPAASHQVIILSTDSEIEGRYADMLTPHLARAYTLVHDAEDGSTEVEEGYAFRKPVVVVG